MNKITVISAFTLKADAVKKLEKTFNDKHNDKQEYIYEIDKTMLGGVLVIDGDTYYDATIKSQLNNLKKILE